MNRTDRLYALVEELRAVAPRPRSARWLADRFEVSTRTIERDLDALLQSGAPIWAEPGRTGGYCLDPARTLPPVNLTPDEAMALALALQRAEDTPFRAAARSALRKLVAAMHPDDAARAEALVGRIHLRIIYEDGEGVASTREVEPLGYVGRDTSWYLLGWCRLRDGVRAFRFDRIRAVTTTAEVPPLRALTRQDLDVPYGDLRTLTLT